MKTETHHAKWTLSLSPGKHLALALAVFLVTLLGCTEDNSPKEAATAIAEASSHIVSNPGPDRAALRCEDCEAVTVVDVLSADTVLTTRGPFRLYGAFIAPESELCVAEGTARLTELVGETVRIEEGDRLLDRQGASVRYLYTESGDSIDELLIAEGTARLSAFEGPHMPWLLYQADIARVNRRGCIWKEFNELFGRT